MLSVAWSVEGPAADSASEQRTVSSTRAKPAHPALRPPLWEKAIVPQPAAVAARRPGAERSVVRVGVGRNLRAREGRTAGSAAIWLAALWRGGAAQQSVTGHASVATLPISWQAWAQLENRHAAGGELCMLSMLRPARPPYQLVARRVIITRLRGLRLRLRLQREIRKRSALFDDNNVGAVPELHGGGGTGAGW